MWEPFFWRACVFAGAVIAGNPTPRMSPGTACGRSSSFISLRRLPDTPGTGKCVRSPAVEGQLADAVGVSGTCRSEIKEEAASRRRGTFAEQSAKRLRVREVLERKEMQFRRAA